MSDPTPSGAAAAGGYHFVVKQGKEKYEVRCEVHVVVQVRLDYFVSNLKNRGLCSTVIVMSCTKHHMMLISMHDLSSSAELERTFSYLPTLPTYFSVKRVCSGHPNMRIITFQMSHFAVRC